MEDGCGFLANVVDTQNGRGRFLIEHLTAAMRRLHVPGGDRGWMVGTRERESGSEPGAVRCDVTDAGAQTCKRTNLPVSHRTLPLFSKESFVGYTFFDLLLAPDLT